MNNFLIKQEPVDFDDNQDTIENSFHKNQHEASEENNDKNLIEKQFELELDYLKKVNQNVLCPDMNEDYELFNEMLACKIDIATKSSIASKRDFAVETLFDNFQSNSQSSATFKQKQENDFFVSNKRSKLGRSQDKNEMAEKEKMAFEKKKILNAIMEMAKEKSENRLASNLGFRHDFVDLRDEKKILNILNKYIKEMDEQDEMKINENKKFSINEFTNEIITLKRLRRKLELRNLKRSRNLNIFDMDSYTNELIDSEKMSLKSHLNIKAELSGEDGSTQNQLSQNYDDDDDDIIFENEILKTNLDSNENSGCEIIAVTRVLDRFKNKNVKLNDCFNCYYSNISHEDQQHSSKFPSIGIVDSRNEDFKCVISPFTNQILKPYVRRDIESLPTKLDLIKQINKNNPNYRSLPIDYVHLRPEHVIPINILLRQHFWNGIDITECLEYSDYTLVVLYGKLIIGFGFLVPNESIREAYLSFIFVHPDWRYHRQVSKSQSTTVSIAQYIMFYLIKKCPDYDVTLHVSVNSRAVIFYQKFGFKIEEFIKNFYDKYYSNEFNLSKDAFLMRYSRS